MTTTPSEYVENVKVAQSVLDAHKAIACANDWHISSCTMPVYKASRRLLINTIKQVFDMTDTKAWRVYDVWNDCMEDIEYCVEYVKSHRSSSVYTR